MNILLLLSLFLSTNDVPRTSSDGLPRRALLGVPFSPITAAQAAKLGLPENVGLVAMAPTAGMTAEKAGVRSGDVIVALNGIPVGVTSIAEKVRELTEGQSVAIQVVREGKEMEFKGTAIAKPRDPGNANYEVIYSHVVSNGHRMRTIITKPKQSSDVAPTKNKHRALMFIQGFSPISYDYTLEGSKGDVATMDGPLLYKFANSGYVTIRVEKPGVGDSEGGPFADVDYTTELDIYRQTLKQLKELDYVDTENIFIFGHSMGGAFGPMIASESPVKGIAVYGVAARTWFEYLLDTLRYQGLVAGDSFENTDEKVRVGSRLMALVFLENKSVEEVKQSHPELEPLADALFPGGLFSGKSLEFWRQLAQTNFPSYWTKCKTHVLAVRGASDFVTYDVDHKLVADVVNQMRKGWGKSEVFPDSDHLFHKFATEAESMQNFQRGECNPEFAKRMMDWMDEVCQE